jgi:ABC-type multidrug transport system fused ATPase/permease subunit
MRLLVKKEYKARDMFFLQFRSAPLYSLVILLNTLLSALQPSLLDEPTASIDPIEESRIYRQFAEIAQDKTAIIVTHRMGSARIADRIAVMDNGTLVEVGTHDELMESGGLYHKLYTAQSDWYSVKGRT